MYNHLVENLSATKVKRSLPKATNPQNKDKPRAAALLDNPPYFSKKTEPQFPKVASPAA